MYGGIRTRQGLRRTWTVSCYLTAACYLTRRCLVFAGVFFFLYRGGFSVANADTDQTLMPPGQDVLLAFQADGLELPVFIDAGRSEVRFRNEPDFGQRHVVRGSIPVGPDRPEFVGFAWDEVRAQLYVDLNQNLDLTDDPGQPIAASYQEGIEQGFRGIRFALERGDIVTPYHFDLRFMGEWWAQADITSGWVGWVTLGGNDYRVSITDNFDGALGDGDRLEVVPADRVPAEVEHDPFEGSFVFFNTRDSLGLPTTIIADGIPYEVQPSFSGSPAGTAVQVRFSEIQSVMGKVQIEGRSINEMILQDWDGAPLLYVSGNPINLPAGTYTVHSAALDGGWTLIDREPKPRVVVRTEAMASLKAGGPLRHDVTIAPSGNSVLMSYAVLGLGGESYERAGQTSDTPTFAVYRGETPVAAGNFEYG